MTILGEAYILIISSLKIEDLVLEYVNCGKVFLEIIVHWSVIYSRREK
jgi:hypothetical protein